MQEVGSVLGKYCAGKSCPFWLLKVFRGGNVQCSRVHHAFRNGILIQLHIRQIISYVSVSFDMTLMNTWFLCLFEDVVVDISLVFLFQPTALLSLFTSNFVYPYR